MHISQHQRQGSREYQEDRYRVIENFAKTKHLILCLVCDGHGGSEAAEFLIHAYPKELEYVIDQYRLLRNDPKKQKVLDKKTKTPVAKAQKENRLVRLMGLALKRCVVAWDAKCFGQAAALDLNDEQKEIIFKTIKERDAFFKEHADSKRWDKDGLSSGSTLNAMLINLKKKRAHIINIGDSRTTWMLDKTSIGQSLDHTVTRDLEPTKGLTCNVVDDRLEGILAMSHSIGDNDQKLLGKVKRDFDTQVVKFKDQDFRAVTATDGLFEASANQQLLDTNFRDADDVIESIFKRMRQNHEETCATLVEQNFMTADATQLPYTPEFVDNVSLIYVVIPKTYTYSEPKPKETEELTKQLAKLTTGKPKPGSKKKSKK